MYIPPAGPKKRITSQSAMEYLMTYGWAILVIAVVLGALYSLGVFNSNALLGTSCIMQRGYLCQNIAISHTSGALSLSFGQSTGAPFGNVLVSCAAISSGNGPYITTTANVYNAIASGSLQGYAYVPTGGGYVSNAPSGATLQSGQEVAISGIQCFNTAGVPLTSPLVPTPVGSGFTGQLWLAYNATGSAGPANNFVKTATLSVKYS